MPQITISPSGTASCARMMVWNSAIEASAQLCRPPPRAAQPLERRAGQDMDAPGLDVRATRRLRRDAQDFLDRLARHGTVEIGAHRMPAGDSLGGGPRDVVGHPPNAPCVLT